MKKYSFLLLFVALATFATPKFSVVISGKITNTENRIVTIKGESFIEE